MKLHLTDLRLFIYSLKALSPISLANVAERTRRSLRTGLMHTKLSTCLCINVTETKALTFTLKYSD